jgi:hypothetical protein
MNVCSGELEQTCDIAELGLSDPGGRDGFVRCAERASTDSDTAARAKPRRGADRVFPLGEADQAHALVESGHIEDECC